MFIPVVDAGFVLARPFHHGDLEPDCSSFDQRGGLMCGIKIPLQDFALKMQGGDFMREGMGGGGAYLRDTTVPIKWFPLFHWLTRGVGG